MSETEANPEPPDNKVYHHIWFYRETIDFFIKSLEFYGALLEKDIAAIDGDPDLKEILDEKKREGFPIHQELDRIERFKKWMNDAIQERGASNYDVHITMSHGVIRYFKSVGSLYLRHLNQRRNVLAARPNISKSALEPVDRQIASLKEKIEIGVFKNASLLPLLADELVATHVVPSPVASENLSSQQTTRPVVIDSIEILDPALRKRCLDLFEAFQSDGQSDRLDTVLTEATRILEDRLRQISGAPATCVGPDLAAYCFGSAKPRLQLSTVVAEQEAAHLLFRGVFGFIRNRVHHNIVENLQPERVLQVVGMVDYLLSIAQAAIPITTENKPGVG